MARPPAASSSSAATRPTWLVRLGLKLRCREATAVMLGARDRPASLHQRVLLRLHLSVCEACTRFSGQVRLMDGAMGQWRAYANSGVVQGEVPGDAGAEAAGQAPPR